MSTQWGTNVYVLGNQGPKFLRTLQLLVGKDGDGNVSPATGLLIDATPKDGSPGLRITFEITKTIYRTPNQALIKIYNLNQAHERQIDREFNDIILQGGYRGQTHTFFRGNIRFTHFYREENDHISEINAGDGDKDFRGALVNFTLAAGHDDENTIRQLVTSMRATTMGRIAGKKIKSKRLRGRTYSGLARDVMDKIAKDSDGHWSIQNGAMVLVPVDSVLPGSAIAISSETGLLGAPEINNKGIKIRCMLDPRIIPGSKLWLQNNDVKQRHLKASMTGQSHKLHGSKRPVRLDPDGVYKVYAVKLVGDMCGADWYCECMCVALDSQIPSTQGLPQSSTPDDDVLTF
jgi:hypothetical protein